ncbi:hypothetical protein QN277_018920 [Acacia crassicarpa]|uniref:Uncharacterized protein n=1 Tax=Acacia crassicarpa TaxID=499986 RepID=A0AAE1JSA6_9FABA|nr:hypothetical protein QN277_018920 [Acacia crassicarpa]
MRAPVPPVNGFMAATMVPRENNEPKKVTPTWVNPGLKIQCTDGTFSGGPMFSSCHIGAGLLGVAAPIAPRRNRRSEDKMLAKAILYADDEIFQRFIENILIDVTPAVLEAREYGRCRF